MAYMLTTLVCLAAVPVFVAPFDKLHRQLVVWPRKYGPVFKFFFGSEALVVITDPELVKEVGVRQFAKFRNRLQPIGAPITKEARTRRKWAIVRARGKYWVGIRAACEPLFHSDNLRSYTPLMHAAIDGLLESMSLGISNGKSEAVEVYNELGRMSLEAVGTAVFGEALTALSKIGNKQIHKDLHDFGFVQGTSRVLLANARKAAAKATQASGSAPASKEPEFFGHAGTLTEDALQSVYDQALPAPHKANPREEGLAEGERAYKSETPRPDSFFYKLLNSSDRATGLPLTDEQIAAQGPNFMLAGYDTVAISLSYTLYELAQNPGIQARITEEVDAFGGGLPSYDDLPRFSYTEACFQEAMRLHTPVSPIFIQFREAEEDVMVGQYLIPKGVGVVMNSLGMHSDPALFPHPEVYRPDRFLESSPDGPDSRHPFAYIPFGAGPHKCVGYRFAMEEAVLALVRLFQRFTLQLSRAHHTQPLEANNSITLAPVGGVWVTVHARTQLTQPQMPQITSSAA